MPPPPSPRRASQLSEDAEGRAQFVQKRSKADAAHTSSTKPPPPNTKKSDDTFAKLFYDERVMQLAIGARSRLAHHPVQSSIKRPRRTLTERPLFEYKSVKAMLELGNMELRRLWGVRLVRTTHTWHPAQLSAWFTAYSTIRPATEGLMTPRSTSYPTSRTLAS
eukprot:6214410-Pleurochrysis_carterae.AAC.2